ncbi:unnamed protein product [Moneuplotes crassus]|uniref:Uncharacterized protein n=1 Tax=Euplotes crassus TaxID=5936 RepID=A0AAD1UGY2_EUPCR|nr:unnamed protein product [Moneuplotes crassus]
MPYSHILKLCGYPVKSKRRKARKSREVCSSCHLRKDKDKENEEKGYGMEGKGYKVRSRVKEEHPFYQRLRPKQKRFLEEITSSEERCSGTEDLAESVQTQEEKAAYNTIDVPRPKAKQKKIKPPKKEFREDFYKDFAEGLDQSGSFYRSINPFKTIQNLQRKKKPNPCRKPNPCKKPANTTIDSYPQAELAQRRYSHSKPKPSKRTQESNRDLHLLKKNFEKEMKMNSRNFDSSKCLNKTYNETIKSLGNVKRELNKQQVTYMKPSQTPSSHSRCTMNKKLTLRASLENLIRKHSKAPASNSVFSNYAINHFTL